MDTNALVTDQLGSGRLLLEALRAAGVEIRVAFWAKLSEGGDWNLYLASPMSDADQESELTAYRILRTTLDHHPEYGIDIFDVSFVSPEDSMSLAANEVIKPRTSTAPSAVPNPKPYVGITRYGGSTFGGMEVDGVYIYPPPPQPVVPA